MRAQPLGAVLSISIDLPITTERGGSSSHDGERSTIERLFQLIAATGQSVAWFANDPVSDETVLRALAAGNAHEAALRVDAAWAGDGEGRNRMVAEIVGRTARARRAGIPITTLSLPGAAAELPRELLPELLVKYGITAIRTAAEDVRSARIRSGAAGPMPVRYGLWRLAVDCRLVGGSRIAEWRTVFGIRRAIDRCVRNATPLHLAIDAAAIAANPGADRLAGLQAILRHVERRRSAGRLRICTIAEVVGRLAAPSAPRAAGSILRAA